MRRLDKDAFGFKEDRAMATATLAVHELPEKIRAAHPRSWWLRGHTYAFVAVIAAQILLVSTLCWLVIHESDYLPRGSEETVSGNISAIVVGQVFLLGLWAALGGLSTIPRWLIVGCITAGSTFLFVRVMGPVDLTEFLDIFPLMALLGLALVYLFAVLLLPLRRLAGWRVDFDSAYHPPGDVRRGQLRLMDFAALSCAVGLPLALSRLITELDPDSGAEVLMILTIMVPVAALVCAPSAYAVLATERVWLCRGLAAAWILFLAYTLSLLAHVMPDLDVNRSAGSMLGLKLGLAMLLFCVAGAVAGPLWVLRLCGLKLLRVA
jgi:hypothetical protein